MLVLFVIGSNDLDANLYLLELKYRYRPPYAIMVGCVLIRLTESIKCK
jgi:hypothetical protein